MYASDSPARPFPRVPSLSYVGRLPDSIPGALLLLSAVIFYLAPWPPLYGLALLAVIFLSWWRLDLALGLVVLFAPFFMVPKHIGSEEFAPGEIFLLVNCLVAGLYLVKPRRGIPLEWTQLWRSPFLLPAALLLLAGSMSTAFAADRHVALRAFREVMLEPLAFFALFLLVVSARESRRRALVGALTAAGLVAGIIALIQLATHQDLTYVLGSSIPRVRALYGSPDNLGLLYDRVIPLWLAIGLVGRLTRPARWFWWAPAIIFAPVLALTFSRGAWVAIAAGCLLTLVLTVSWGRWLALACALLAALSVALAGPTVSHAFSAGHANTVRTRIDIWESSISMLKAHPLFGVGPDNFLHYYAPLNDKYAGCRGLGYMKQDAADQPCLSHPHDEILDFWLSTGVLGLLAFLWLQLVFWRSAFHSWRADSAPGDAAIVLGCMAAMAAGLVHGLVDNSYFLPDLAVIFWLLCGLVSSIPATSDRATGK